MGLAAYISASDHTAGRIGWLVEHDASPTLVCVLRRRGRRDARAMVVLTALLPYAAGLLLLVALPKMNKTGGQRAEGSRRRLMSTLADGFKGRNASRCAWP